MLTPRTVVDIQEFEDDLAEIAEKLRKMRQKMQDSALMSVELETEKARKFVDYLKIEWANTCISRVEKAAAVEAAIKLRERKKAQQSKSK